MLKRTRIYPKCVCGHSKSRHEPDCMRCDCAGYKPKRPRARNPLKAKTGKPKRFAARRNEAYCAWIRAMRCTVRNSLRALCCEGEIQVCHVKTRGSGGDDEGNVIPMCAWHHARQHSLGIRSFESQYGVNLKGIATELFVTYEREILGKVL